MGFMCDFCGEQRSMIYCQSDAASLCLSCDQSVHSANALSKRHSRTLVCDRCNSQPAFVRCVEERASMCQNCDRSEHAASTSTSTHRKQLINCYSGCPSGDELSTIWPFLLDNSASMQDDSTCEKGIGLLTIAENSLNNDLGPTLETEGLNPGTGNPNDEDHGLDKSDAWMGCSPTPELSAAKNLDQPSGFGQAVCPKTHYPGAEITDTCEDDFFAQLDMDDFNTNFENYEELFDLTHTRAEQLLQNGGMDDFVMINEITAADSGCPSTVGAEGSIGAPNALQPACSNAASADSNLSIRTEPPICFGAKQAHSGVSITVECGGGDYQDCSVSSMRLLGESFWCPPESSPLSGSRTDAVLRYKEKKKSRKFEKKVRYASRKERADVRKRVKGRFIKAGDAYDYDPLNETRSF